ncbi:unnamed protein product [Phytomonas sp. EM1]|nr:unnamed protein product [Phytomonas sp. EM1]|eukprot:CCW59765.1 unnamed protein product [Phytomonas sp. isolate EM1]
MESSTEPSSFLHFPSIAATAEGGQLLPSNPTFVDKSDYRSFYNYKASKGRTLLRDQTTLATELPTLLPKGLHYIANFVSFEDLYSDGAFKQSKRNLVSITSEHLSLLYRSKCIDRGLIPSWEREVRFMEFLSCNCKGNFFCLPETGLGPASAEVIKCILSNNKTYSVLDLSDNYLRDEGAQSIGELLRVNRTLVHVGLSSNDISHKGASAIASALEDNKTVVSLDLGARSGVNANHIGSQGAEALGKLLKVNQVLSKLDLGSNGLGPSGLSFLASSLIENNTLTHLNLSSNNLGRDGARILAKILECCRLVHLSLERNALTDVGGHLIIQAIHSAMRNGESLLKYLDLKNNSLGEHSAKAIGKILPNATNLQSLILSSNEFGESANFIAEGLMENKCVNTLDMSNCKIRENVGVRFGNALFVNTTLKSLNFSKNKLKDRGAKEVSRGLAVNKALVSLNLASNMIGDEGGKALAAALVSNNTLRELDLKRNTMSTVTGNLLYQSLRGRSSVDRLDATYNDFSYKCFMNIKSCLERNAQNNKQLIIPKLRDEIEVLEPKQMELFQTQEKIDMEKRIIKDRTEQLLRRTEEARVISEKMKRSVLELEKNSERSRVACEAEEAVFQRTGDELTTEMSTYKTKKASMDARIQQEKERVDKLNREIEKMRYQIKRIEESENERLAPLLNEMADADTERDREKRDAKSEAEKLVALSLRQKELEVLLNHASGVKK